jgi:hypothetical protein
VTEEGRDVGGLPGADGVDMVEGRRLDGVGGGVVEVESDGDETRGFCLQMKQRGERLVSSITRLAEGRDK